MRLTTPVRVLVCFALLACFQNVKAQTSSTATLRGHVVDARSGEPLAKVKVIVGADNLSAVTNETGQFVIDNVPIGDVDLYITTVSYGLVKKTIKHTGDTTDLKIALNEDAATLTETVSITLDPYERTEANAASEQSLNKRELQSLSSILIGDPVRAAQSLPGVATGDDFRSEFSVRGAGFDRIGLYFDGILTENFVHTIQGGYSDTGSVSVINADTVRAVSLLSGAFPSPYGDRTGSVLDINSRDGNRIKPTGRITGALSGVAGVVDGPFDDGR